MRTWEQKRKKWHVARAQKRHVAIAQKWHVTRAQKRHVAIAQKWHVTRAQKRHVAIAQKWHVTRAQKRHVAIAQKWHVTRAQKRHVAIAQKWHLARAQKRHVAIAQKWHLAIAQKLDLIEQNQCDFWIQRIRFVLNQLKRQTTNLSLTSVALMNKNNLIDLVQLATAEEYTNCVSVRPTSTTSVLDMTLNKLMMRLLSKNSEECGVPFHNHSDPKWSHLLGSNIWVK